MVRLLVEEEEEAKKEGFALGWNDRDGNGCMYVYGWVCGASVFKKKR